MSELIRRAVGQHLYKLVPGAQITGVDVSDDLRYATVWLQTVGDQSAKEIQAAAAEQKRQLQRHLGRYLKTKYTPSLTFKIDRGTEHAEHIEDLINHHIKE